MATFDHVHDIQDHYSIALTSRHLRQHILPFLYRQYVNVNRDPFDSLAYRYRPTGMGYPAQRSLWPFVRSFLLNPELGRLVKEISIGRLIYSKVTVERSNFAFPFGRNAPTDLEYELLVKAAKPMTVIDRYTCGENKLLITLLSLIPAVEKIAFLGGLGPSYGSECDIFGEGQLLSRLTRLKEFHEIIICRSDRKQDKQAGLLLCHPSLRALTIDIHRQHQNNASSEIASLPRSSMIQDLTIRGETLPSSPSVKRIVNACKALKSFCYEQPTQHNTPDQFLDESEIDLRPLQHLITPHLDTLTRLSIGTTGFYEGLSVEPDADMNPSSETLSKRMLDLSRFHHLQEVEIPLVFIDQDMDISFTPEYDMFGTLFSDHGRTISNLTTRLPQSLQKLSLLWYEPFDCSWFLIDIMPRFSPRCSGQFPHLRFFSMDLVCNSPDCTWDWLAKHREWEEREQCKNYFLRVVGHKASGQGDSLHGWGNCNIGGAIYRVRNLAEFENCCPRVSYTPRKSWYQVEFAKSSDELPNVIEDFEADDLEDSPQGDLDEFYRSLYYEGEHESEESEHSMGDSESE